MMMTDSSSSVSTIAFLLAVIFVTIVEIEGDGLTPEDVRFATLRCQNDSTHDSGMRLQWSLRMFPDNHETHCYVKCLLSKLGLIDLKYRGLDSNKFTEPLENEDIEISEECFAHLEDALSGTCESYYRKWMDLRTSCKEFFYITLFEDPREVERFNNQNLSEQVTLSKKFGEAASEFCSNGLVGAESRELTSEQAIDNELLSSFKCELGCVFRHFRYFDVHGRVDSNEIQRSFQEASSSSISNNEIISKCVQSANSLYPYGPCQMAYELYQCLTKKVRNFKQIYAERDKISRYF